LIDLASFVGRFHPLLVHFPIGILLLAVAMQVVATVAARRGRAAPFSDRAIAFVLGCGAMSAVAAATTGYLLGGSGGYTGETFDRHETLGIGVAVLSCVATLVALMRLRFETFLAERSSTAPPGALAAPSAPARAMPRRGTFWGRTYAATLIGVFVMLTWAGHLGATLTHGEGYLTEHAPEPVLQARCVQCHGAAKMEGELRLDGPDSLRKGGKSGPAFVAGQAAKSELVRRIWLPASDSDVMPPRGQRPLTPAEASLIRWWIERGAKFDQKVMEAEISPDVRPAIEAIVGPIPIDFGGPTLPKVKVAPAAPAALANVRATGVSIVPLSADTPFVQVHCTNVRATFGDAQLAALEAIAPQILWLDVSGTQITDAGLAVVEKFPNLTRLHLHRTAITDAGVMHLARLSHLEYLNLYETKITDTGLASLAGLPSLRALYVWRTGVTTQGIDRLKASLPRLVVD
jgi:uncharacterized membrane protein/mono/diheme cytochrome c family protein